MPWVNVCADSYNPSPTWSWKIPNWSRGQAAPLSDRLLFHTMAYLLALASSTRKEMISSKMEAKSIPGESWLLSAPGITGCQKGSSWGIFITKFRFKLKKVGKTTRPFRYACTLSHISCVWLFVTLWRYDLNQIHYNHTVEVTNRFKGLSRTVRVTEELWTEVHNVVQEMVIKTIPKKKKCKEKQNGCLRKPYK